MSVPVAGPFRKRKNARAMERALTAALVAGKYRYTEPETTKLLTENGLARPEMLFNVLGHEILAPATTLGFAVRRIGLFRRAELAPRGRVQYFVDATPFRR